MALVEAAAKHPHEPPPRISTDLQSPAPPKLSLRLVLQGRGGERKVEGKGGSSKLSEGWFSWPQNSLHVFCGKPFERVAQDSADNPSLWSNKRREHRSVETVGLRLSAQDASLQSPPTIHQVQDWESIYLKDTKV